MWGVGAEHVERGTLQVNPLTSFLYPHQLQITPISLVFLLILVSEIYIFLSPPSSSRVDSGVRARSLWEAPAGTADETHLKGLSQPVPQTQSQLSLQICLPLCSQFYLGSFFVTDQREF